MNLGKTQPHVKGVLSEPVVVTVTSHMLGALKITISFTCPCLPAKHTPAKILVSIFSFLTRENVEDQRVRDTPQVWPGNSAESGLK